MSEAAYWLSIGASILGGCCGGILITGGILVFLGIISTWAAKRAQPFPLERRE